MERNEKKYPENKDLPGYPHYPAKDDITQPDNNNGKVSVEGVNEEDIINEGSLDFMYGDGSGVNIVMGTEADVTPEDMRNLNADSAASSAARGLDETDEDGDPLNDNGTGADMDVPGSEEDDANEDIGEEDEENNYYSRSQNDNENTEGIP